MTAIHHKLILCVECGKPYSHVDVTRKREAESERFGRCYQCNLNLLRERSLAKQRDRQNNGVCPGCGKHHPATYAFSIGEDGGSFNLPPGEYFYIPVEGLTDGTDTNDDPDA